MNSSSKFPIDLAAESKISRRFYLILVLAMAFLFFFYHAVLLVPCIHPKSCSCPNAYLVGGKMLSEHGSLEYRPVMYNTSKFDPFRHIGGSWVGMDIGTDQERYYPKFPIGLPAIYAAVLKMDGKDGYGYLVFWINPVLISLSLLGVFLIVRMFAGSFMGFMSVAVFGSGPLPMTLVASPHLSHVPSLFCVVWGIYMLFRWWQSGSVIWAVSAGLVIGYAVTIRYTEGALLLVLILVIILSWPEKKSRLRYFCGCILLLLAWALPVLVLLYHNIRIFHSPTGYDLTGESTGFAWKHFQENWETMFKQIDGTGLFMFFPLGVCGLAVMAWLKWRMMLVMASWVLPCLLVHTAYYWAPDDPSYARFFLSALPALLACAFWMIYRIEELAAKSSELVNAHIQEGLGAKHNIVVSATGLLVAFSVLVNLHASIPETVEVSASKRLLQECANDITRISKPDSVVIILCNSQVQMLQQLQFTSGFQLYNGNFFNRSEIQKMKDNCEDGENEPEQHQSLCRKARYERLKNHSQAELTAEICKIIEGSLDRGRDVYCVKCGSRPMRLGENVRILPGWLVPPEKFDVHLVDAWQNRYPPEREKKKSDKKLGRHIHSSKEHPDPKYCEDLVLLKVKRK